MGKVLHIIATPRGKASRTLQVSSSFLAALKQRHPDWRIDSLDLYKEQLPPLSVKRVDGKYMLLEGKELFGEAKESWEEVISHIERFLAADLYVISSPMWNFHIPYQLKHYIDLIVQPKYLFRYTDKGIEGLAKNKKMVIITSRGGQYTSPDAQPLDFQEPYLRQIFQFVGITDITFLHAQPMDMGPDLREERLNSAKTAASQLAERF